MKRKSISIFMVLLPLLMTGQTSVYHPIPESGAIWREYYGGFQVSCRDYQLSITGEIEIDGYLYHELNEFGVIYFNDPMGNCLSYFSGTYDYYRGAFRNDSLNKKVYFWDPYSGEHLLYDFNLDLNDPLPETYGYPYFDEMDTSYVSSIDSVLINGQYHKRFAISTSYFLDYVYLIEGIGSSYGFLASLHPPFEFGSTLVCFLIDSTSVYPEWASDCELVTGLREPSEMEPAFSLYPNPAKEGPCRLSFPDSPGTYDIVVLNQTGKAVARQKDVKPDAILDLNNLDNGVYLVMLYKDQQPMYHTKLIIYR